MKKLLSLLTSLLLLAALCACGTTPAVSSSAPPPASSVPEPSPEPDLLIGFGRADISPVNLVPLGGYEDEEQRMSNTVVNEEDRLYTTCVAITDKEGETVLLYTNDLLFIEEAWMADFRKAITEATGIPADHIMLSATHTHSAPNVSTEKIMKGSSYYKLYQQGMVDAAVEAMADRAAAAIQIGSADLEGMSFVRHYVLTDGTIGGSNFGHWGEHSAVSHASEANQRLQLIRFVREDAEKKDVLLVNWQGHATRFSSQSTPDGVNNYNNISADYIGYCRSYVEANSDCLFAFYLNASGHTVTYSRIAAVNQQYKMPNTTRGYGEKLGGYVLDTLSSTMTDLETGLLSTSQQLFLARNKATGLATVEMELDTVTLGELAFFTAPYEMIDTHSVYIRDNSPYTMTFGITCANGYFGYVATREMFSYRPTAYEVSICPVGEGAGEELADALLSMLKDLHS